MKPFLTDNSDKITLIEIDNILDEDGEVAEILNNLFSDAPKNLGVVENSYILSDTSNLTAPVDKAIKKCELHPSILEIRKRVTGPRFSFDTVALPDIELEIRKLNPNKATACDSIPIKLL